MNAMFYKGYSARIEFDDVDRIFVGHVTGIRDVVGFHGSSVDELEAAFHEAVNDYLAHCAAAQVAGISLNQWATRALDEASHV